jgi:hypothetical protein
MAKTTTTATDTELTMTPESIAAIVQAAVTASAVANKREIDNPPPAWWNGYGLPDFPKPVYAKVYFCGAEQKPEKATKREMELFNAITVSGDYGPDRTWPVKVKDGVLDIRIIGINKREVRSELPRSLVEILQIIVDQQNAAAAA